MRSRSMSRNLTLPNQTTHNVIFIATEHDSVYAFDADNNGGANSGPLWQASMISTAHGAAVGRDHGAGR